MIGQRLALTSALMLSLLPVGLDAQVFEGRLKVRAAEIEVEEDDTSVLETPIATLFQREGVDAMQSTVLMKGKRIRVDGGVAEAGEYFIWDLESQMMWLVFPRERAYAEYPAETAQPDASSATSARPRALGQRTINGMQTTGYEVRTEDSVIRAWMTKDHPGLTWSFRRMANEGQGDAAEALLAQYGFPVLVQTLGRGSLTIEEVLSIERAALADDMFRVPAGFQKKG